MSLVEAMKEEDEIEKLEKSMNKKSWIHKFRHMIVFYFKSKIEHSKTLWMQKYK